jgi:L-ascorbate metabolism protein UlaG (beta-lactamase superfamily)
MGDTGLFGDLALTGHRYRPDLLLVPIGDHFVIDPSDPAEARMLRPHFAIPMHYRTMLQLASTPEQFIAALGKTASEVKVLQPGETAIFDGR